MEAKSPKPSAEMNEEIELADTSSNPLHSLSHGTGTESASSPVQTQTISKEHRASLFASSPIEVPPAY